MDDRPFRHDGSAAWLRHQNRGFRRGRRFRHDDDAAGSVRMRSRGPGALNLLASYENFAPLRVIRGPRRAHRRHAAAEGFDLVGLVPGVLGRHVAVDDALADRVAVAAARRDAEKRRPKPVRLAAIDRRRLVEKEAAEPAPRALALRLRERLAADEVA